jgi:hypothetical protein
MEAIKEESTPPDTKNPNGASDYIYILTAFVT